MTPEELKKLLGDKWTEQKDAIDAVAAKSATKEQVQTLEQAIKDQGILMADAVAKINSGSDAPTFEEGFVKFMDENKDELKTIIQQKAGEVEFIFDRPLVDKAVGDMTTASGTDNSPPATMNVNLSRINFRNDNPLIGLCNVIRTNRPGFAYTEVAPKEGDYTFVAEGNTKPQIDFLWNVRYAEPHKIAAHEIFTEEVVRDIPRLMDTARGQLKDMHDLKKADGIYFGDGIAPNPSGATVIARTFVAGAMADALTNTTIMDVINAIVTDIYTTHNFTNEAPYMPNVTLMNPVDFFINFQAAKDANKWPLYGGVQLFNSYQVGGMTILPWEKIPAGKIFVGDMSKYNISNWVRYSVRLGYINDQFITNKFTMVGESRSHYFVKNFDQQAFVYDDIATVQAAIDSGIA